jgi:hypothetical protein
VSGGISVWGLGGFFDRGGGGFEVVWGGGGHVGGGLREMGFVADGAGAGCWVLGGF